MQKGVIMQSPTTDKDLGVGHSAWGLGDDKFRSVRQKAQEERQELKHRSKKDKTVKVPVHAPGDKVVVTVGYRDRAYRLIEVIDFSGDGSRFSSHDWFHDYYGILLKTTIKSDLGRIGRLCTFSGGRHSAHVGENDVRWLEEAHL
jgi:hypothetical protein